MTIYKGFGKMAMDKLIAIILLILFLPFFIIVIIAIKLDSSGPIFFRQIRVGKDLHTFPILKLRSMTNEKREVRPVIGRAPGVTRVGYYLRRYKIDELPQLWHVLMGQMSLVGPRPSIPEQLATMSDDNKKRYSVRPGLTGLAQVSGNILLSWEERYRFDLIYVQNLSFRNDLKILLRTAALIIKGEKYYLGKPLEIHQICR